MAIHLRCACCGRTDCLAVDDVRIGWRVDAGRQLCPRCSAFEASGASDKSRLSSAPGDEDDDGPELLDGRLAADLQLQRDE